MYTTPYLSEADGEDGMRTATGVIYPCSGSYTVGVPSSYQLFHVAVVMYEMLGQI